MTDFDYGQIGPLFSLRLLASLPHRSGLSVVALATLGIGIAALCRRRRK